MPNQTMYSENVYFPDAFKGCGFDCVYCGPSFQRQAKRQKQRCQLCYEYKPHFHPERLIKPIEDPRKGFYFKTPKTTGKQFVFFPKGGDPYFATVRVFQTMMEFVRANPQTTFLVQSKSPGFLADHTPLPDNVIVGTTAETDRTIFITGWENLNLDSPFKTYGDISKAPNCETRLLDLAELDHPRKSVTVEPILWHSDDLVTFIQRVKPEFVYVGYDTKNCKLPEPSKAKTLKTIAKLEAFTEVRLKTIREAWWYESRNPYQKTWCDSQKKTEKQT
jgi:hypothetical protein